MSVTLTFPTQHPTCLSGEQGLSFSLGIEQTKPSHCHRMAELFHFEPAHCDPPPEDETTQLLVDLLAVVGREGEDLCGIPD